jgi:hypothetical protein
MSNNERTAEIWPMRTLPNSKTEPASDPREHSRSSVSSSASEEGQLVSPMTYEFIDSQELASRLAVPSSWIRDQIRARSQDPLPHVNFGKYVRFLWGSPPLELWIRRHIVMGNNRRLGRTQRKEQL